MCARACRVAIWSINLSSIYYKIHPTNKKTVNRSEWIVGSLWHKTEVCITLQHASDIHSKLDFRKSIFPKGVELSFFFTVSSYYTFSIALWHRKEMKLVNQRKRSLIMYPNNTLILNPLEYTFLDHLSLYQFNPWRLPRYFPRVIWQLILWLLSLGSRRTQGLSILD